MFVDLAPRSLVSVIVASGGLLIAGCSDTRGGSIPYDRALAAPDAQPVQTLSENYRIAPLDKLSIKVFKAEDLSGDYDVDLAGHISLPLVGEVEAANLTTAELDQKLTDALGTKYFEHPDVSVAIKQSTAHVVTVDGAVNQAGQFQMAGPLTLIQTVALARGTSQDANPRRVAVFRTIGREAAGGRVRPDRDPAWRIARSADLSRRHRRGRRIEDQGTAKADPSDRAAARNFRSGALMLQRPIKARGEEE